MLIETTHHGARTGVVITACLAAAILASGTLLAEMAALAL